MFVCLFLGTIKLHDKLQSARGICQLTEGSRPEACLALDGDLVGGACAARIKRRDVRGVYRGECE